MDKLTINDFDTNEEYKFYLEILGIFEEMEKQRPFRNVSKIESTNNLKSHKKKKENEIK